MEASRLDIARTAERLKKLHTAAAAHAEIAVGADVKAVFDKHEGL